MRPVFMSNLCVPANFSAFRSALVILKGRPASASLALKLMSPFMEMVATSPLTAVELEVRLGFDVAQRPERHLVAALPLVADRDRLVRGDHERLAERLSDGRFRHHRLHQLLLGLVPVRNRVEELVVTLELGDLASCRRAWR